jgi:RluA family pseudouridine synthase
MLVVDKPAGLPALVDGYHAEAPYLIGILQEKYDPLWVVHRLDKDTSGVIVFARTAEAHRALNIQFESRQTEKVYHALVVGTPDWNEKVVRIPLRPDGDRRHRTVVDSRGGKPSVTGLRVLECFQDHALVEAVPRTGRAHQIRAHLAALGHPIAGDGLYGGGEVGGLGRMWLHACSLKLRHPITGEEMGFRAPYPEDLERAIERLRSR